MALVTKHLFLWEGVGGDFSERLRDCKECDIAWGIQADVLFFVKNYSTEMAKVALL